MEVGQFLLLPTYLFSDLLIFKIAFQIDMNDKVSDVQNKVKILEGSLFWIELSQNICLCNDLTKTQRKSRKMLKVSCDLPV
jgi:hypothetical protein